MGQTIIKSKVIIIEEDPHEQLREFVVMGQASRGNHPKGNYVLTPNGIEATTRYSSVDGMELLLISKVDNHPLTKMINEKVEEKSNG